ncbi:hypothetical protein BDZ91DRAFT_792593 [Kalaharituber pfeilii]|nr:hypothetical protein BDZ91DRAFT_792593 [Kalaharituber pfeilii]
MPVRWDSNTDRQLLLAILETSIDYDSVAAKIGNGCSAIEVYGRLLKLRKMATEGKHSSTPKAPSAASKGKKGKGCFNDDDDDERDIKPQRLIDRKVKVEKQEPVIVIKEEISEPVIKTEKGEFWGGGSRAVSENGKYEVFILDD